MVDRLARRRDQLAVGVIVELRVGPARAAARRLRVDVVGHREQRAQVEPARLPVVDSGIGLEQLGAADQLRHRANPERGHDPPRLLSDEPQVVDDVLGLAGEPFAQHRVLGRHPDGTGVEVADAHHHAAERDQRRGRETELVSAENRGHDDIAAGAHLAVDLDEDPRAQVVAQQRLLRLGEPDLPGDAGVLDRRERRRAGAAIVASDNHVVGVGLGDPSSDRADTDLGHQLDRDPRARVGAAQVVDQLLEVFDRVDVVVRRRRDQTDAGRRVAELGDVVVDLVARQLATLAGLGALGDLDLDLVGVDEVVDGHAEAAGRHLLDRRAALVAPARRVLAALTCVGLAAEAVHRHRQRLVRLGRERTEAHAAGLEALEDLLCRLYFFERHRVAVAAEPEQPAQRRARQRHLVDVASEALVGVDRPFAARGVLQVGDRLGVPAVEFAVAPPLVDAAVGQQLGGRRRVGARVPVERFARQHLEPDAANARRCAGEVAVDELAVEPDRLEDLSAGVRGDR
ncbi:hypothetical protein HRbin41_00543 [bacterium HR41]|nr:hypothetical protein HRbin41_00543 [bacterium HR41]